MKIILVLFILSVCFSLLDVEKNNFTIISFRPSIPACDINRGDGIYYFQILGNFTEVPLKTNPIEISLNSPEGAKAMCFPEESLNFGFKCQLFLNKYNLYEKLIIDPQPPLSEKYDFINWNKFFKENSIDITCNEFISSNIKIEKIDTDYKYAYIITGKWNDIYYYKDDVNFELELDNIKKTKLSCSFYTNISDQIICYSNELEAIKFKDTLVKFGNTYYYKFNSFDGSKIDIEIKYENNKDEKQIGENGIIIFKPNYNSNISVIFNIDDIDEQTSFITHIKDENGNIDHITCKLWYSYYKNLELFCKLDKNFEIGPHEINLDKKTFKFYDYYITISFSGKFNIKQTNISFPFLYSKEQIININDKSQLYELKFKAESYHNETLIIKCDAYNLKILNDCNLYNKDLICIIKKKDLEKLLTKNGNYFSLAYYNDINGLVQFLYVSDIKINLDISKKGNLYINITKLLVNTSEIYTFFTYKTNITDMPNIIDEPFKFSNFKNIWCYFRKYTGKPLLLFCSPETKGIYSLGIINKQIILENIHAKYNFIITPVINNDQIEVVENSKSNLANYAFFLIPPVLDFNLYETLTIDIFTQFNTSIRINPDSDDLKCEKINYIAKRCIVPKSHFENKTNDYYFVNYLNYLNKYTPFYEMPPIQIILSQDNNNLKEKSYRKMENINSNNNSNWKLFLAFILFFAILVILFSVFYAYRNIKRKNKEKVLEEFFS